MQLGSGKVPSGSKQALKAGGAISADRMRMFKECMASKADNHGSMGLEDITIDGKLTKKNIDAIVNYMNSAESNLKLAETLTYSGMEKLSEILCRWPRPSEISRIWGAQGKKFQINRYIIKLNLPTRQDRRDFVGPMGQNLIDLTRDTGIMYAWLHTTSEGCELRLYGTKDYVKNALTHQLLDGKMIGPPSKAARIGMSAWAEEFKVVRK